MPGGNAVFAGAPAAIQLPCPHNPDKAYASGRVLHITLLFDFACYWSPLGMSVMGMTEKYA